MARLGRPQLVQQALRQLLNGLLVQGLGIVAAAAAHLLLVAVEEVAVVAAAGLGLLAAARITAARWLLVLNTVAATGGGGLGLLGHNGHRGGGLCHGNWRCQCAGPI